MKGRLNIFADPAALAHAATEKILYCLNEAILEQGRATIVLSGGNTPRTVYELLASEAYRGRVGWSLVHIFWGDERSLLPTTPGSNFRMANEVMLQHLPIPPGNVHRIPAEHPPQEAARVYEAELREFFETGPGEFPRFTIVLLGLGDDGHTASLFPDTLALRERSRIVCEVYVDALDSSRITMTAPALNSAGTVLFLVTGKSKAAILREVLLDETPRYPAQMINPVRGELLWYADRDAASQLDLKGDR